MVSSRTRARLWCLGAALALAACGSDGDDSSSATMDADASAMADAGTAGDAGAGDAGASNPPVEKPIDFTPLSWDWLDVPGTTCQDDKQAGVFVHKGTKNRLVLYLEGGGACFTPILCGMNPQSFGSADIARAQSVSLINDEENSPFAGYHKVFMGYCSGDIFSGSATDHTGFENRTQQGYLNVGKVLEKILPEYKDVEHVVLAGSSAGGFGAAYNWARVQEAFGTVPVYLIDDAGPPMREPYLSKCLQEQLSDLWKWEASLPADCGDDCNVKKGGSISKLLPYYLKSNSERRFALLSTTQDSTITGFFAYGQNDCMFPDLPADKFEEGLFDLRDYLSSYENFAMWITPGSRHTYLISDYLTSKNEGVELKDWLGSVVTGGEQFKTRVTNTPNK